MTPDYLAHMYQQIQAKQADLVIGGYYELDEQAGKFLFYYPAGEVHATVTPTEKVFQQIGNNRIMTACGKLYRRNIFAWWLSSILPLSELSYWMKACIVFANGRGVRPGAYIRFSSIKILWPRTLNW